MWLFVDVDVEMLDSVITRLLSKESLYYGFLKNDWKSVGDHASCM